MEQLAAVEEFYTGFSRQELMEVLYLQRAAIVDDVTLYISLLFGFIGVAYLVGDQLSKAEKLFISVLYSCVMAALIFAIAGTIQAYLFTVYVISGNFASLFQYSPPTVLGAGWLASIWFMYRSRKLGGNT
jgi:hypothetical protein